MKSRKFPSFNEAISYLESKGTLTYWGWVGNIDGYYYYTYVDLKGSKWHMNVYKSGKIEYRLF